LSNFIKVRTMLRSAGSYTRETAIDRAHAAGGAHAHWRCGPRRGSPCGWKRDKPEWAASGVVAPRLRTPWQPTRACRNAVSRATPTGSGPNSISISIVQK